MTDFQGPRCSTCRYWFQDDDRTLCRRFPPTPIVLPVPEQPNKLMIQSQFPVMLPSGWCGEYQPAS